MSLRVDTSKFNKKTSFLATGKHDSRENHNKGECSATIINISHVLELTPVEKG